MVEELKVLRREVKPHHVLLVVDAMTGQDAVTMAQRFNQDVGYDGIVLTKLDGDARGGAALSIRTVTGKPIVFCGVGERVDALEPFHPDRMASRILGMGDVLSLVEKAQATVDASKAEELAQKIREDSFTLEDFAEQLRQLRKMGPLDQILDMVPFFKGAKLGAARARRRVEGPPAVRGDHRLDDAGRAADAGDHQRRAADADRARERHVGAGREPAAQAVRAAPEDDEGHEGHERAARAQGPAPGDAVLPRLGQSGQAGDAHGGTDSATTDGHDEEAFLSGGGGGRRGRPGTAGSSSRSGSTTP